MHHRFADLADAADARRWLADHVDLLLHGHQHEETADLLQGPDSELLVLAAGCLYEGDEGHRYRNACQVIDLELDEDARPRGAQVRLRVLTPEHPGTVAAWVGVLGERMRIHPKDPRSPGRCARSGCWFTWTTSIPRNRPSWWLDCRARSVASPCS